MPPVLSTTSRRPHGPYKLALVTAAAAVTAAWAQGGGGGGATVSGQTSLANSACGTTATACATDGSTASTTRSLVFDTTTGIFTGYMLTNQCPSNRVTLNGVSFGPATSGTPTCINQTFPAPAYRTTPIASPLRFRVGLSIRGGENIYGPMDAGFAAGFACSIQYGTCDAGTDVEMCEARLEYMCGTAALRRQVFMDDCGGHANPWHYHCHMKCEYNLSSPGHSSLVGVMLDGRGLYGLQETTAVMPTDLDACGGHVGPVPATTVGGTTYPAATNVYHYHVQHRAPFLSGCYGPVQTMAQALALYPTCSTSITRRTYCTSKGEYADYMLDCPITRHRNDTTTYSQPVATASCPACQGSCVGEYYTSPTPTPAAASASGTATASGTPSRTPAAALPSVSPRPSVVVGLESSYREVTFTFTVTGATQTALRNATVIAAIRATVAAYLNVSVELVQVVAAADVAAARRRVLQSSGSISVQVVVRTTPSEDSTTVVSRLSAMTTTTLAPVTSALATVTGQSASAFALTFSASSVANNPMIATTGAAATSAAISGGGIAGIVIGVLAFIAIVAFVAYAVSGRNRKGTPVLSDTPPAKAGGSTV